MSQDQSPRERLDSMIGAFIPSCILGAAAELELFDAMGAEALSVDAIVEKLHSDPRATVILLDAAASLELLEKSDGLYRVPEPLRGLLTRDGAQTVLPAIHLRMNMLRSWSQLAWVTRAGIPAPKQASIRGPEADRAAFLAAMHSLSEPVADDLIARFGPPPFEHLLDVGGASGTWTLAFLRAAPRAKATIFDLEDALGQARARIAGGPFADRVTFARGDFYTDELPGGVDLAWVSAIVHQHSRRHNRELFAKVHSALVSGGRIAIRDVVMEPGRTRPSFGAMFAVNMLVHTDSGDVFTFRELSDDLTAAGFVDVELAVEADDMSSVVVAVKP